jgi:hypothetical protein
MERHEHTGEDRPAPVPCSRCPCPKRPQPEARQASIGGEMRGFACADVEQSLLRISHMQRQSAAHMSEHLPGGFGGEGIRRQGQHHGHPEEWREPVSPRLLEPPARSLWASHGLSHTSRTLAAWLTPAWFVIARLTRRPRGPVSTRRISSARVIAVIVGG